MKKTDVVLIALIALVVGFVAGNEYQKRKKRIINDVNPSNTEGGTKGPSKRIIM
jgi:hypothetical protein